MQSPTLAALTPWHDFFTLLGAASATMTGLLFVAASVGSGIFSRDRTGALRVFLSGSVVLFGSILAVCLIGLAPIHNPQLLSAGITACGGFGMIYYSLAWRDLVRDRLFLKLDWEDRIWYAVVPMMGVALESAAGLTLAVRIETGCVLLAIALGILLLAAIRNAWDITVWSITRQRE